MTTPTMPVPSARRKAAALSETPVAREPLGRDGRGHECSVAEVMFMASRSDRGAGQGATTNVVS